MKQDSLHTPRAFLRDRARIWRALAVLGAAGCILMSFFRFVDAAHGGAVVAYLLYPAALCIMALLVFTRDYARFPEIRWLGAFLLWTAIVAVLNSGRADGALSSSWFQSQLAISFLCFSLPYAFERAKWQGVLSGLAAVTIVTTTLFAAGSLVFVALGRTFALDGVEGVLGMSSDGRLELFCHANAAASMCGISLLLCVYLFCTVKKRRFRVLVTLAFLICFVALSLTDSRTGILGSALAFGLEALLIGGAFLFRHAKKNPRILLCLAVALLAAVLFYLGTLLVRGGYNRYAELRATAAIEAEAAPASDSEAAPASDPNAAPASDSVYQQASQRDYSDAGTFNGRVDIWLATFRGLMDNPSILLTGATPLIAGQLMTPYFPAHVPQYNFHNSLVAALVGLGVIGLLFILLFLAAVALISLRLMFSDFSSPASLHVRLLPAVVLLSVIVGMMEQMLFVDPMPTLVWVWLMLAAGFLFRFYRARKETQKA